MKNLNEVGKMTVDFDSWKKLVPVKKILEGQPPEILFVDLMYTREIIREEVEDRVVARHFNEEYEELNPPFLEEEGYQNVVRPEVYSKRFTLTKYLDLNEIQKDFLENVIKLSEKRSEKTLERFSFDKNDDSEKLLAKIRMASNFISVDSKFGQATNIIVSEENYHKYNLETIDEDIEEPRVFTEVDPFGEENWEPRIKKYTITIENVNDIYIYRKNDVDQPGLALCYDFEKYNFIDLGFFPGKQFMKIILK